MLKALYIIAIGLLFAGFIGFGVVTFYSSPKYPDCQQFRAPSLQSGASSEMTEDQNCKDQLETHQQKSQEYSRNLSLIYLIISIIVIAISLFGIGSIPVIGDGLTLGGILVLFTSLAISFASDSEIFRFLTISAGLAIILVISYWKFIRHEKKPETY